MDQLEFTQALLDPNRPVPTGLVDPQGRVSQKRFAVYRNNVVLSLAEALTATYPVIQTLLGAEQFAKMAAIYLRQIPPVSPKISDYGDQMPLFLARFAPVVKYPYLGDVASLEWGMRCAYHAADAGTLDAADFTPDALMGLTLRLAPATQVIRSTYPVFAIWTQALDTEAPAPQPGAQDVLITRPEFDPQPHFLPHGGAQLAAALTTAPTLLAALEATLTQIPDADIAALLTIFLNSSALMRDPESTTT
jgi:hypothetical protein